mmetsp:Transcript_77491/g.250829  ORF Transcript_77491/g.250829 Transcript_77491/m.250829 type:complete len:913 (-) Transcript_77491:50-2788(-)
MPKVWPFMTASPSKALLCLLSLALACVIGGVETSQAAINALTGQLCHVACHAVLDESGKLDTEDNTSANAAEALVLQGAEINAKVCLQSGLVTPQWEGVTPLICAATYGNRNVFKKLLKHGASVTVLGKVKWTALMGAATYDLRPMVNELLDPLLGYGVDINATDSAGRTAVMFSRTADVAQVLVDHGADIDALSNDGGTSLMVAASLGHTGFCSFLLDRNGNASVFARDRKGTTAAMKAAQAGRVETLELLLERRANLEDVDYLGHTMLHLAAKAGQPETVKFLVRNMSANRFALDSYYETPRDLALSYSHLGILEYLPTQSLEEAYSWLFGQWEFYVAICACIGAGCLASAGSRRDSASIERASSPTSRGARKLAGHASVSFVQENSLKLFRAADIFTATAFNMRCMQLVAPKVWIPIVLLLYVVPAICFGVRFTTTLGIATMLSSVPASLVSIKAWRPKDVAKCIIGLCRLVIIFILFGVATWTSNSNEHVDAWYLNTKGQGAVRTLETNPNAAIVISVPYVDTSKYVSWEVINGSCTIDKDRCLSGSGYEKCYIETRSGWFTWVVHVDRFDIFPSRWWGYLCVNGQRYTRSRWGPEGIAVVGNITWFSRKRGAHFKLCPTMGQMALVTYSVGDFWRFSNYVGAFLATLVLLGAVATTLQALWPPPCRPEAGIDDDGTEEDSDSTTVSLSDDTMLVRSATLSLDDLAKKIDSVICNLASDGCHRHGEIREALEGLRGTTRHVEPVSVWCSSRRPGVKLLMVLIIADMVLDLVSINIFILGRHVLFASCLFVTWTYVLVSQLSSGRLWHLRDEVYRSAREGKLTDGLLDMIDQEHGTEGIISLLVSAYGLPFAVKTPIQALTAYASIALSTYGAAGYLFDKLDLEKAHSESVGSVSRTGSPKHAEPYVEE